MGRCGDMLYFFGSMLYDSRYIGLSYLLKTVGLPAFSKPEQSEYSISSVCVRARMSNYLPPLVCDCATNIIMTVW